MTLGTYHFTRAVPPVSNSQRTSETKLTGFSLLILALLAAISFLGCALSGAESTVSKQMAVTPSKISFGGVRVGQFGWKGATVTNQGTKALTISHATLTGSSSFFLSAPSLPLVLAPGKSTAFGIKFAPPTAQPANSKLIIATTSGAHITIPVTGWGGQSLISVHSRSLNFGSVSVGANSTQTLMITNSGNATLTVTREAVSGPGFSLSRASQLIGISDGQTVPLTVRFAPQTGGGATGILTLVSDAPTSPLTISLSGNGVSAANPQLSINPTSINFNHVTVGSSSQQPVALTNTGNVNLTITQVAPSGAAFSVSGIATPLTLTPGQNSSFSVKLAPSGTGTVTGSVTITSNANGSPATISLLGAGVSASNPQLGINPTNFNFNNVTVGSSSQHTVSLTNTGNANVTISQALASGAAFSISGIATPLTLTPGQNSSFSVKFAPSGTGTVTGSVTITSNASGSPATISLSGTGVAAATPHLAVTPNTVNFSTVVMGMTSSQTMKLTNTGSASLTVNTASVSGTGFGMNSLSTPLTLSANQSATFTVQFAPQNTGAVSGSLLLTSNDPNSPTTVQLSGTGIAATFILTPNPPSVNFGNVNVGSNSSQNVTLTNSGNSNVNISQVNVTGNSFSATGIAPPVTLMPGQVATLSTKFSPSGSGNANGNVQVVSNASSPTNVSLSGTGVQPVSHSATLTWTASTTQTVVGYNIYRGGQSGGPYTKLNASPVAATTFVDATVQAGQTYFWVVTAVDSSGTESAFSNEVTATVPTP